MPVTRHPSRSSQPDPKGRAQDIIISVHVNPEQKERFKKASEVAGLSLSRYIVRCVEDKMDSKDPLQAENRALREQLAELRARLEQALAENARLQDTQPMQPVQSSVVEPARLDRLESITAAMVSLIADLRDQISSRDRLIDRLLDAEAVRSIPHRPETLTHRNRTYRLPDPYRSEPNSYGDAIARSRALADLAARAERGQDLDEALRRLFQPEPIPEEEILARVADIRRQAGL